MTATIKSILFLLITTIVVAPIIYGAENDAAEKNRKAFVEYFTNKFPEVKLDDFINGVYAIDKPSREQYNELNEFPPYENELTKGEDLFNNTKFANGKTYADCFENGGKGIRQNYPYFDTETNEVITLEYAINQCRTSNGEKPLKWKKGKIAWISAYMAYTSRGNKLDIKIPNAEAKKAYERGMKFYYSKRGYLNNSCATCHVQGSGQTVRVEVLHPALGEVTHMPIYRLKWGGLGTLHRRIEGCHRDQGAAPYKAQSKEYRELEYFMTYMSNGLTANGPDFRK